MSGIRYQLPSQKELVPEELQNIIKDMKEKGVDYAVKLTYKENYGEFEVATEQFFFFKKGELIGMAAGSDGLYIYAPTLVELAQFVGQFNEKMKNAGISFTLEPFEI